MRRLSFIFASAFLAFCACGGKTPDEPSAPMSVSPSEQAVDALGEKKTFTVTSASDWYARSDAAWAKLVTASGKGGASSLLIVEAGENKDAAPREAVIAVSNLSGESVSVKITQGVSDGSVTHRGIATAEDLLGFAKAVNGEGSIARYLVDGVVKILNDIDASSITEWIPAGTELTPLTYNIDGNNRSIKNVNWTIDVSKYPYAGFVGCAKGVTISKLTLGSEGSKINFTGTPSGKLCAGGIVAKAESVTLERATLNASLSFSGTSVSGDNLIMGGIVGQTDAICMVGGDIRATKGCVNNGNITLSAAGREGGIVGYNLGSIQYCSNYGTIKGPSDGGFGPGWLCSYNKNKASVINNYGYGFVGDTPAMMRNSMMNCEEGYDIENNVVDWTLDAYYDWEEVESRNLASGAVYRHYSFTNVPRHMRVFEVDLKNPGIELCGRVADDIIPNPNGNGNTNNGFMIRETLSMICSRKRAEGQKIIGGVNACFFDSNDGISRGFHVEEGEPLYINNPAVVSNLANHAWGFTVFTDGTASCGKKKFTGRLRLGDKEYPYYTINDTTLRHVAAATPANLFTSRYVQTPHSEKPKSINDLAANALYVICEYTSGPMKVNTGYAPARVVDIRDGRFGTIEKPYISEKNRVGIALSGTVAEEWAAAVKVGDIVELKCDIAIDGDASKPIFTLISTMYLLLNEGKDGSGTVTSTNLNTLYDPMTFAVVSQDASKVWIVEIDGRQAWYSIGVKGYEIYRIASKLGGWWATRMDGGGSAAMWVWNPASSSGALVSSPSDDKGERSCLTYLLLREK